MAGEGDSLDSLRRRREELAAEVAKLHWDLGGLTYEMAIRDHFRLDVLVRRAAALQERDAELAELERLLGEAEADARPSGLSLPGPGVAALMVLAMLGFGVLTGVAVRGGADAAQARRAPLRLTLAGGTGTSGAGVARGAPLASLPPSISGSTPSPSPGSGSSHSPSPGSGSSSESELESASKGSSGGGSGGKGGKGG
ncbi:MAG TPA: hypothetical protein VGX16_03700, partial [Solirubrobacteraceae bacterium]|nr:hypothetical protein [Solirubrobacteraceae bacterium]